MRTSCALTLLLGVAFPGLPSLSIAAPPTAAATDMITVNAALPLNSGLGNGNRLGINVNYWEDDQSRRPAGSPLLSEALAGMKVTHLRYPGGSKSDITRWSVPPYDAPNPRLALISASNWPSNDPGFWSPAGDPNGGWTRRVLDFDAFMAQCRAMNCEPNIVVAYGSIYMPANGADHITRQEALDMAAAWVRYANVTRKYNIQYWEIGNETWLDDYANHDPGRLTQANDLVAFSRAMKSIDPTIKIGANANSQADFDTLLSVAAADIDFLVVHRYPPYGLADYAAYQATTLNTQDSVSAAYNALQNYPAHSGRIKIMMTEISGMTFGAWKQADLGHALMTFESVARALQDSRVEFSMLWNTHWIDSSNGEAFALTPANGYTPQGWALYLLGHFMLDRMVSAVGTPTVIAFASTDAATKDMNVFLVNKSLSTSQAQISFQNYTAPTTGSVLTFAGAGPADQNPGFGPQGSLTVTGNAATVSLSPTSITVIQFRHATRLYTVTPCRLLDTRNPAGVYGGPALSAGQARLFSLAGRCGIPPTARGVAVNVTVTQPGADGYLSVYPGDGSVPTASSLSFRAGVTRANNALTGLSNDGTGGLTILNGSAGTAHVILDVNAYFQ